MRLLDRLYDGAGALAALCVFLIFVLMITAGMGRQVDLAPQQAASNDVVARLCASAAFFAMAPRSGGDFVRVTRCC